ncbi:transmembrane protein 213 isoform X2 [Tupaia chinensis]|uniref:transmembrane protein 213 isoform X2 n=1 Tax=Tupaia chinensis TaxID=246437 RepID=UPI000FFC34F8|nr:transmembrane protein 213 isoform X2 [Tupaia chinensis]
MALSPQHSSTGTVQTDAALAGRQCLPSATWAALLLSLVFASFHSACWADVDFCPLATRCCHIGVDEYGWIAAAVGWSLWFLTLILLCVNKLMKLTPDEPKGLQA